MKGVLVASNNQSACNAIRTSLRSEYRIDAVSSKDGCLEMFRKKRYEFLFIDVEFFVSQCLTTTIRRHCNRFGMRIRQLKLSPCHPRK